MRWWEKKQLLEKPYHTGFCVDAWTVNCLLCLYLYSSCLSFCLRNRQTVLINNPKHNLCQGGNKVIQIRNLIITRVKAGHLNNQYASYEFSEINVLATTEYWKTISVRMKILLWMWPDSEDQSKSTCNDLIGDSRLILTLWIPPCRLQSQLLYFLQCFHKTNGHL